MANDLIHWNEIGISEERFNEISDMIEDVEQRSPDVDPFEFLEIHEMISEKETTAYCAASNAMACVDIDDEMLRNAI